MVTKDLLDYIYAGHRWLSELEKTPRNYGTGEELNPSSIHTLSAISKNPGCNLTQLAQSMDISKPAASKFVSLLRKNGYLIKHTTQNPKAKEFVLSLTEKGRIAVHGHDTFSQKTFGPLRAIEQNISVADRKIIQQYLENLLTAIRS